MKFLTPNLNLDEAVNSGKSYLFFDCPLLSFGEKSTVERFRTRPEAEKEREDAADRQAEAEFRWVQRTTYDDAGAEQ